MLNFANKSKAPQQHQPGSRFVPIRGRSGNEALQAKLKVNTPGDHYEQEADDVANKVLRMEDENAPHDKTKSHGITPLIQSKDNTNIAVGPAISDKIKYSRGQGSGLDSDTQKFMSSRFGHDLSTIKIHANEEAARLNQEINARAFTVGRDIYFNEGEYQPGSEKGKLLLGHELTHVIQQQQTGAIQRAPQVQAPVATNWWDDKSIGIKPQKLFWDDMTLFFPKDKRKFSGSGFGNVTNIECDDRRMVVIGKAYAEETDALKRKAWLVPVIEKADLLRYNEGRIDNEDLTNIKITGKLKALSGNELKSYIKKLTEMGKYITNDQVIAYLNADDKDKTKIISAENEKLLDWKFTENRLTDADLKDEKTNTRLRGLNTAQKLEKETKAKEFAEKTGEDTAKLQTFLHTQTQTSTPVPDEATVNSAGGFTMSFPNVDVIVLPDKSGGKGNETSLKNNLPKGSFNFSSGADGLITSFFRISGKTRTPLAFPSKLVITIQTSYQDISKVDETSAYGKGTTEQDIKWGATTLRFHEGSHGKQYIDFIRSHNFPSLAIGSVTPDDITTVTGLLKQIDEESCLEVDQVGTTQDDYLTTEAGKKSGIVSCKK